MLVVERRKEKTKGIVSRMKHRLSPALALALFILALVSPSINSLVFAQTITPIQLVQGPTLGTWSSGKSFNVILSNTPTSGDVLVCTFGDTIATGFDTISSIADANGKTTWTKQVGNTYHGVYYYDSEIWYGTVDSASASKTITITLVSAITATYAAEAYVSEYSGMATSDFLDKTASNQGTGSTTDSGMTANTTQADELWLASIVGSAPQSSPTNGFTLAHYTGTACDLGNFIKTVSATGIANTGATIGGVYEHDYVGCIATFFVAGGAAVAVRDLFLIAFVGLIVVGVLIASGTICFVLVTHARRAKRKR
jgi:hypothetical protein